MFKTLVICVSLFIVKIIPKVVVYEKDNVWVRVSLRNNICLFLISSFPELSSAGSSRFVDWSDQSCHENWIICYHYLPSTPVMFCCFKTKTKLCSDQPWRPRLGRPRSDGSSRQGDSQHWQEPFSRRNCSQHSINNIQLPSRSSWLSVWSGWRRRGCSSLSSTPVPPSVPPPGPLSSQVVFRSAPASTRTPSRAGTPTRPRRSWPGSRTARCWCLRCWPVWATGARSWVSGT